MSYREMFPRLRPQEISYDKGLNETGNLLIRGQLIFVPDVRLAFIKALKEFEQEEVNVFDNTPNGTRIQVDTVIGDSVKFGCNSTIGGFGFGYELDIDGNLLRMPHLGKVVIEDNVTIHDNVCVDRGVLGNTVIGSGTRIDNLVHISHNVIIGKSCAIVAQAGIGGSCVIGDSTFIGFGAHIKNKVKIGSGCTIGMGAVVLEDVPDNWVVVGNPAKFLRKNE